MTPNNPQDQVRTAPLRHIDPEDCWFPEIRVTLEENPGLFTRLRLVCLVCASEMLIAGDGRPKYPRLPSRMPGDNQHFACGEGPGSELHKDSIQKANNERLSLGLEPLEPCMVMFCGHVFCESCALSLDKKAEDGSVECPLCKKSLYRLLCKKDEYHHLAMIPFPASSRALADFPPTSTEGGLLPPDCAWCFLSYLTGGLIERYEVAQRNAVKLPVEAALYWATPEEPHFISAMDVPELRPWQNDLDHIFLDFLAFAQCEWAGDRVYMPGLTMRFRWAMKRGGAISD